MYQRRHNPSLTLIVIFGVIGGIAFLMVDQSRSTTPPTATPVEQVENTPMDVANLAVTATPIFSGVLGVTPSPTPIFVDDLAPDIQNASLLIPNAGIAASIVRVYVGETSWDVSKLGNNIGHLQGTRWLPENGNVVLSGHVELADGRQGVFANLHELQIGDRITIMQDGGEYHYDVTTINMHEPTDLEPVYPTDDNRLTLITCGNYDFFSDQYLERVVVVAEQVAVN